MERSAQTPGRDADSDEVPCEDRSLSSQPKKRPEPVTGYETLDRVLATIKWLAILAAILFTLTR